MDEGAAGDGGGGGEGTAITAIIAITSITATLSATYRVEGSLTMIPNTSRTYAKSSPGTSPAVSCIAGSSSTCPPPQCTHRLALQRTGSEATRLPASPMA